MGIDSDIVNNSTSDATAIANDLNSKTEKMLVDYQAGQLFELLNVTNAVSFASTTASDAQVATATDDSTQVLVAHAIPAKLQVNTTTTAEEYLTFGTHPVVNILDSSNNPVTTLGGTWSVNVSINSAEGELLGPTTKQFGNGTAEFDDLRITHAGTHTLTFQIETPTTVTVQTATMDVVISQRTVNVAVTSAESLLQHDADVDINLELRNSLNTLLENAGYKGHTYTATVTLDSTANAGSAAISGTSTVTFDNAASSASLTGLKISNTVDYNKYNLIITVTTTPALYTLTAYHTVQFYNPSTSLHTSASTGSLIKITLAGIVTRSALTRSTASSTNSFETFVNNYLTTVVNGNAYIASVVVTDVNSNTEIEAAVNSADQTALDTSISLIQTAFSADGDVLTYNGVGYRNADSSCVVQTNGVCDGSSSGSSSTTSSSSNTALETWVIIVICLAISIVMGILIVGITCYLKREKAYSPKIRGPMACVNANGSMSTIGSNLLRISPGADSPDGSDYSGYHNHYRDLPSRATSAGSPTSMMSTNTVKNLPKVDM